ncbi:protein of unknown function [Candidatus Filomicrobium marinum]|uniref:Uncharacterized protein n=1 Tax=Candidatus Filomicrobium marinum TaxID=1608628 RepID=A0A0D6JB99_9HYPH|nr:protein of unknown function [Candidatus Filomicrobium marinum]CPR16207.1 protein of unknown function [Candidatus Filomicrobium marinum]
MACVIVALGCRFWSLGEGALGVGLAGECHPARKPLVNLLAAVAREGLADDLFFRLAGAGEVAGGGFLADDFAQHGVDDFPVTVKVEEGIIGLPRFGDVDAHGLAEDVDDGSAEGEGFGGERGQDGENVVVGQGLQVREDGRHPGAVGRAADGVLVRHVGGIVFQVG